MSRKLSLATKFFLLSGYLLADGEKKNWQAPTGEMIDGDLMFEEAFLLQLYWLVKSGVLTLTGSGKELKVKKSTGKLTKAANLSGLVELLVKNLPRKKTLFHQWIKTVSLRLAGPNPAQAMLQLMKQEAKEFRKSQKSKFFIFTINTQTWDKEKIEQLAKTELVSLQKLWQKARQADWWEDGRRMLKAGLTFARMRKAEER